MDAPHVRLLTIAALLLGTLAGCSGPPPAPNIEQPPVQQPTAERPFKITGFTLQPVETLPYEGAHTVLDVHNTGKITVNADGIAVYERDGREWDHPVRLAQYASASLVEFHTTGERQWLDRAVMNADRLLDTGIDRDGALWFPYPFEWTYTDRTLSAPWFSGMAQGQALSTFVRLAETQPEEARWEDAAERTWRSFRQERSTTEPWSTFIQDGDLWFEEYAGDQPPLMVLNGQIFGLYGIYDYFMHTGDPEAELYFDGGATTVLTILPDIRVPGELSYYCVQPDFCQIPRWQAPGYHAIHIKQLEMLAQMTGDNVFTKWSDLLLADSAPEV